MVVRKDIQHVKSVWSVFHSELKANVLHPLEGNNTNIQKINTHACVHMKTVFLEDVMEDKFWLTPSFLLNLTVAGRSYEMCAIHLFISSSSYLSMSPSFSVSSWKLREPFFGGKCIFVHVLVKRTPISVFYVFW